MRAAEYVRASTDHQQYSIVNQQVAIAEYAALHKFEVVRTYADPAKSGLDLKHRPGLQSLLDDVLAGRADYKAVLVFDVSRWGRFQDSDEAACYEFLCKRAGIKVHYCAESFPNDGTPLSALLKTVKRTMAAEYLRDLSARVLAGQCRLAANGFKLGGRAGFGLRRLLLDAQGQPKHALKDGERKYLATERVIYTLGPDSEIRVVREIYSMFLEQDFAPHKIARLMNERGVKYGDFGAWGQHRVRLILTHPKYAGCVVFNKTTTKLRSRVASNPREQWVMRTSAFPAIVSLETFARAQAKMESSIIRRSSERLLAELRQYLEEHGKALPQGRKPLGLASHSAYRNRFGGLMAAYKLIGYQPRSYSEAVDAKRRVVGALKQEVIENLKQHLNAAGAKFAESNGVFRLRGRGVIVIVTARSHVGKRREMRWTLHTKFLRSPRALIVIRLGPDNDSIQDFVVYARAPRTTWGFTLHKDLASARATVHNTVADAISTLLAAPVPP